MSLFKVRELWETNCGADESFDHKCITVAKIGGISDKIIVGSHNGFLRIYEPSYKRTEEGTIIGYRPTDLLLEVQFKHPILQVSCGKLVSGSQNTQICILHPRSVAVFNYLSQRGATEHGDQNHLVLAYEHNLRRSAFSMLLGPFGGVSSRDFICVQSLDGALSFFEQETFTFVRFLPAFLLPGPLAFLPHTDAFITVSSNWHVECYRYQVLAESGTSDQEASSGRKLIADWTYNLGEGALDMKSIVWPSHSDVVILGEKNLYCLRDNGTLKFMKRFEYRPRCLHCYIVEPDGKLMVLVVTDTDMVMVYEQTTLRWSAKLLISPVLITRISIDELHGVIVVMSDSGQLECCYLGTEPSLFMPPPLEVSALDYEESRRELMHLQKIIRAYSKENSNSLANTAAEKELGVTVNVSNQVEPCEYPSKLIDPLSEVERESSIPMCRVSVELTPHAPLSKVQVAFIVSPPLGISQVSHSISSLCDTTQISVFVYLNEPGDVSSLKLRVVTSYIANTRGVPRILQNVASLPLKLIVSTCPANKEGEHKITINTTHPAVGLAQLFPEFIGEGSMSGASNSIGFVRWGSDSTVVSAFSAKTSQRYRIQSDSFPAMCILAYQLQERLEKHFSKSKDFACSFSSSLPMQGLFTAIDSHFTCKRESYKLQEQLNQRATQYRVIQRRLLVKFKDKTPAPLSNLDVLLKNTFHMIKESSEALEENQQDLARASCQLQCSVQLLILLLRISPAKSHPHFDDLIAALNNPINDSEDQGWEEVTNVAISYLLRTCLARTVKEQQKSTPLSLGLLKDTTRFKKHVAAAIDRVTKSVKSHETDTSSNSEEKLGNKLNTKEVNDSSQGITTIPEEVSVPDNPPEEENVVPAGSRFAENQKSAPLRGRSANLLKARKIQQAAEIMEVNKEGTLEETTKESVIERTVSALERDKRFNELAATIESPPEIFAGGDDEDMW